MAAHWERAAQSYRAASQQTAASTELETGIAELEQFMRTEGAAAMTLLQASGRHINFAETDVESGFCQVYLIDGEGLRMSTEPAGMAMAYTTDRPKPKITLITARQAIEAAVTIGGKKATEVVAYLRSELDRIAAAAPSSP